MRKSGEQLKYSDEIYEKNLELYSLYDPLTAVKLGLSDHEQYEYCYTHLGELNICRRAGEHCAFYHDIEGAHQEAKDWFRGKDFSEFRLIFIYGVGLGYYYEYVKLWLKENPHNRLIFLEDEIGVIEKFLGTELATEILSDPQVVVHYIDLYPTTNPGATIHKSIDCLLRGYVRYKSFLGSTKLYSQYKEFICVCIRDVIFYISSWYLVVANEILAKDGGVLTNHYHNFLRQHQSSSAHHLKNKFRGVPAVICGAGPSIVHDIDTLKTLRDQAIIIGSGTGMNVLNHYGIIPHFGTGLDPTSSQGTRIRTNYAYEVPFFYRPRFQAQSFKLLHGPKLYIQGHPCSKLSGWFDEELGLELEDLPNSGVSSTNFSMQIARFIGCSPIILLGIDLAYVDASRYPPIISAHPTDSAKGKREISQQSDVPINGKSNSGNNVLSKIEWFEESKTIASFKSVSPDLEVISCSADGLAINKVKYMPFDEAVDKYMTKSWDLRNLIHMETVSGFPTVDKEKSFEKVKEIDESIIKCRDNYRKITSDIKDLWDKILEGMPLPIPPYNGNIALLEEETWEEPTFLYQIGMLSSLVDEMAYDKKKELRCHSANKSDTVKDIMKLEIDLNYLAFFEDHLAYNHTLLTNVIEDYEQEEQMLSVDHHEGIKHSSDIDLDEEKYRIENDLLIISDTEMGIELSCTFNPQMIPENIIEEKRKNATITDLYLQLNGEMNGQYLKYNAKGFLEAEMFYSHGKLHGPSTVYHENGTILARSWYVEGEKQGKTWQWYPTGMLSSIQRYRNGVWDGIQEYFYRNGYLKSKIEYKQGRLHGEVKLYYENGLLKRELHFIDGTIDGSEKYFNFDGNLIWEAEYSDGMPTGHARIWHKNGQIEREYEYSEDHKQYILREWNKLGQLTCKEVNLLENLQQINEKRQRELVKAVGQFNKDLLQLQYLTKQERMQFVY